MLLLDRHGEKSDVWTRIETACEDAGDHVLALLSELDGRFSRKTTEAAASASSFPTIRRRSRFSPTSKSST